MGINERINNLMQAHGLNKNQLAIRLGVAATVIGNITGGRMSNPSYDLLMKILLSFDDVNAEWLMRGTGRMSGRDNEPSVMSEPNIEYKNSQPKSITCDSCNEKERLITQLQKENERLWKIIERENGENQTKVANCG